MINRKLLLLVSLVLWEELGAAGPAVKVVRRRGLGAQHSLKSEGKVLADQWEVSPEKMGVPSKNLKDLLTHDQAEHGELAVIKKLSQNYATTHSLLTKQEDGQKLKLDGLDSLGHGLSSNNEAAAALEPRKTRNGTRNNDGSFSKPGRVDKGLPIHHKIDFGLHPNRTRAKSPARSTSRMGSSVRQPSQTPKGPSLDSPRKLNLTGSYGVLKLISKENLVRIVNSQLQSMVGLNFQGKASRSRKRDLIDVDRSQSASSKVKRQDRAVSSDLYSDNQTEEPRVSATSHSNLNAEQSSRSVWKPVSEFSSLDSFGSRPSERASPKSPFVTETWSSGPNGGKRLSAHPASTPQAEVLSTQRDESFGYSNGQATLHSGTANSPLRSDAAASPSVYALDPWGVRTVSSGAKREKGGAAAAEEEEEGKEHSSRDEAIEESIQPPELESSVTQDPVWAVAERPNSSHILRLRPEAEWAVGKTDTGGGGKMAADSWAGTISHGLMFEEAAEEEEEEGDNNDDDDDDSDDGDRGSKAARGHNEGGGKRSRSRRSWIWNQFFVIEEYTGPEPVLIGRVRLTSMNLHFSEHHHLF